MFCCSKLEFSIFIEGRVVAILLHKHFLFKLEKNIKDKEGRYVFVLGYLYGEMVTLGSVYAPNSFQIKFFASLLRDLASCSSPFTVLGGDCIMDADLDRKPLLPLESRADGSLCFQIALVVLWCHTTIGAQLQVE
uniref:Uncharacterized protein n=1 Tax=Sinocyclocheilus anshuiensis TaxID=1608454 RepID=A0A671S197_9TELE